MLPEIPEFEPDVVLQCVDLAQPTSRRDLFDRFEQYGPVAHVDYNQKDPTVCFVRFMHAAAAQSALEHPRPVPNASRLAGEHEKDYWDHLIAGARKAKARIETRDRRRGKDTHQNRIHRPERGQSTLDNEAPKRADELIVPRSHVKFGDDDED
jgi:hypothetical protein